MQLNHCINIVIEEKRSKGKRSSRRSYCDVNLFLLKILSDCKMYSIQINSPEALCQTSLFDCFLEMREKQTVIHRFMGYTVISPQGTARTTTFREMRNWYFLLLRKVKGILGTLNICSLNNACK